MCGSCSSQEGIRDHLTDLGGFRQGGGGGDLNIGVGTTVGGQKEGREKDLRRLMTPDGVGGLDGSSRQ